MQFPELPANTILGLNYGGAHDSAIALVSESGETLFACSLERITRVKQDGRPPLELLEGLPWNRIAAVAVPAERELVPPEDPMSAIHPVRLPVARDSGLVHGPKFRTFLDTLPVPKQYVCHHLSHAASAFWPSGFDDALCLVYDGGMPNSAWFGGLYRADKANGIQALDRFNASHYAKIATLYTSVTALLGFTPNKHEGKITGLAAYGKPTERCREVLWQLFTEDYFAQEEMTEWFFSYSRETSPLLLVDEAKRQRLKERFAGISREEMAATVQAMTEEHILQILDNAAERGWTSERICLSGGLFANVKINQRVKAWGFKEIFISPPMTDDGTALGAALHVASLNASFKPKVQKHVYIGPSYTGADVAQALDRWQLNHEKLETPAERIAEVLAQGAVVALFQDGMEFGPRALGNRSIISQATDAGINKSLNDRLLRTEFMPFAPITRLEDMTECYVGLEGAEHAAEFMTITCDCTDAMRELCPAVVHVDGTARPQLVSPEQQPLLHEVLSRYRTKTGRPALINTSFNIHEEPIVCTPDDAIKGFLEAGLDYLYLEGGYWLSFAKNREQALDLLQHERGAPSRKEADVRQVLSELFERINAANAREAEKELELGKLKEKDEEIQTKDTEIADLKGDCDTKDAEIEEKDAEITALKGDCDTKDAEIEEKDAEIVTLKEDCNKRDLEIASLLAACDERLNLINYQASVLRTHYVWRAWHVARHLLQSIRHARPSSIGLSRVPFVGAALSRIAALPWTIAGACSSRIRAVRQSIAQAMLPRIGVLYQYPPRPMVLPASYRKLPNLSHPPRISIVTPSYNQAAFLERTIESVLNQGYPNLEYIVQDGGSKDGSVAVLEKFSDKLSHWQSAPDGGQTAAINLGFHHATGDILAYLNSDDLLLPGVLHYVADYFDRHPEVDAVYGHRIIIDEADREIGRWVMPPHDGEVLSWADFVPQETLFWRRRIWDKIGSQLDESFHFAMDWDLLLRLRDAGANFVRLPRFMAAFRVHPQQKTSAEIGDIGFKEMTRLRERSLGRTVGDTEIRLAVAPYLMRHVLYDKRMRYLGR